ncbi:hypothetical protein LC724_13550 [Blautia sp. RD014234]|nr:hypothetical protein [Blautia parvula]
MGAAFSRLLTGNAFMHPMGRPPAAGIPGSWKKGCASLSVEWLVLAFFYIADFDGSSGVSAEEPGEKRKYRIWKKRIRGTAPFVCRFPLQNRQVRQKVLLDR